MRLALVVALALAIILPAVAQQRHNVPPHKPEPPALQPPFPSGRELGQPPETETRRAQRPADAEQRGTEQSPLIVKVVPSPNTEPESRYNPANREKEPPSDWWFNGGLIVVGILQLFVFGLQARRLRQTIVEMRKIARSQTADTQRLIRISRLAALAGARQARSAVRLAADSAQHVELVRESLYRVQRAFIYLHQLDPGNIARIFGLRGDAAFQGRVYPSVRIRFKNLGKTPGNIRSAGFFVVIADEIPPMISADNIQQQEINIQDPEMIEIIIGENEIYPAIDSTDQIEIRSETPFTVENTQRMRDGNTNIYCHGWIEYLDIFMDVHPTVFCRKYIIGRQAFVPVGGMERFTAVRAKPHSAGTAQRARAKQF